MFEALRTARGVVRSLRIYYGDKTRARAMDALYRRFVKPGDLVFDIGAHVGDRIAAFRRLGARVVAAEPQAAFVCVLKLFYGRDSEVAIRQVAVGRAPGETELMINVANPTISTASREFIGAARGASGWERESWTASIRVPVTTLDALIAEFGAPAFVKIDVEGYEAEVLGGLTHPVAALSFEFTTIQRAVAQACVDRCRALGFSSFNAALGESQILVHGTWLDRDAISRWLSDLPHEANSGDVYAVRT